VETDNRPFRIALLQSDLDDLLEWLSRTCWPNEVPGVGSDYAASLDQVKALLEYWPTG
jgi:epoxide hydrolase